MQNRLYWAQIGNTLAYQVWLQYEQDIEAIAGAMEAVIATKAKGSKTSNLETAQKYSSQGKVRKSPFVE
ncbi:hypothetical protein F4Y93_04980 [Candidatus Poribacteria bacterium]|nr:hypothetical protein [Candidatus Poribacteria bacterium]